MYPRHGEPAFPAVLFSPAQGTTRLFYSAIAQTVASYGYIAVTIDTPYDEDIIEYPDGFEALQNNTIVQAGTGSNPGGENAAISIIDLAVEVRAQDASFVLDQLTNKTVVSQLIPGSTKGLNVSKVGMFGHSLGGAATAAAMLNDTRIAGGLNMDGALWVPLYNKGLTNRSCSWPTQATSEATTAVLTTRTIPGSTSGQNFVPSSSTLS